MKIILPKTFCPDLKFEGGRKLFFLAGPILGAEDWQTKCAKEIEKHLKDCYIAIPRRYQPDHEIMKFKCKGQNNIFDRQLSWERHYLTLASSHGCIIFWLPCESKTNPRTDGKPYAMDTRGELGEWRGHLSHSRSVRVVIGAEPNFPGLDQIQRNYDEALCRSFPIYQTLEETVIAALNQSQQFR